MLAASASGAGFALSLFSAKSELAQLSSELVQDLGQRLRGLDRFSRTERLAAAHSVVALTAYFETLACADLPFDAAKLELTKSEQVALAQGRPAGSNRLRALAAALLQADVPMPAPQWPYELTVEAMRGFYEHLSDEIVRFVAGLAVYEQLDETTQRHFIQRLSGEMPGRSVGRYEELFRQFAVEFPEVAFWANLVDQQATRAEIRRLGCGLAGLEQMLANIESGRMPDERRLSLSRAYRKVLNRPIFTAGEIAEGLRLPALADAYVNPYFRVAEAIVAERLAEESWWNEQPTRDDLEGFLAGHLTAPQAVEAPLLLLGQPGSGKSVLTKVLAARLPPDKFLVVRVVLRDVAADADVQSQIEHAVRSATGESIAWPDLARSTGGALPIVLLDGFDELLQATGVSQTDYLKRITTFQAREADQGRPVAVLVTSRTAVADRAQPVPGMVVLRLEPFRDPHIKKWLEVWNDTNAAAFARRGLQPLALQTALAHTELASQPLLLLMLALYDADGNPLQNGDAPLGMAELYERLLTRFAEREVGKSGVTLAAAELADAVERELLRLSVVAFAMFNRGRQWVTETELDADLTALLGQADNQATPAGLRAPLTAAQTVIGRFFFVYEAQATRDNTQLRTYEFLHATFGEYLIARLVTREVGDFADAVQFAASRSRPTPADDAFLHALLSFMPLTMRGTIVAFTAERLRAQPESRCHLLSTVLLRLFRDSLSPRHDTLFDDYNPLATLPVPQRYAAYTANLIILAVLTKGQVTGTDLFPTAADPAKEWRRIAFLWRSQLPEEGWTGLIYAVIVDRIWHDDQRDILLRPAETEQHPLWNCDPLWSYNSILVHKNYSGWQYISDAMLRDQARFTCDTGDDSLAHALEPLAGVLDTAVSYFQKVGPDRSHAVSAANALITLWMKSSMDSPADELTAAYDTCLEIMIYGFPPFDTVTRERFRTLVLRQLASDQPRVSQSWLGSALAQIRKAAESKKTEERSDLLRLAREMLPELMAASSSDTTKTSHVIRADGLGPTLDGSAQA